MAIPAHSEQHACKPQDLDRVLGEFRHLASHIYRPSGEEAQARNYILGLVAQANEVIRIANKIYPQYLTHPLQLLTTRIDQAGNLLVVVPATGKFVGRNLRPIALQSHLDMVMAAASSIDTTKSFFEQPIELETVEGWIQSKGRTRTIGADNGLGVVLMARYILDFTLDHPELELLFTVHEEAAGTKAMVGASHLGHKLRSPVLINLDAGRAKSACVGCQGAQSIHTKNFIVGEPLPSQSLWHATIRLDGLTGGHSGGEIHLGRANGVRLWALLMQELSTHIPSLLLTEVRAGSDAFTNVIPTSFEFKVAIPKGKLHQVNTFVNAFLASPVMAPYAQTENLSQITLQLRVDSPTTPRLPHVAALNLSKIQKLTSLILDLKDGVVTRHPDFPNQVQSSSNLAYAYLLPDPTNSSGLILSTGFLARSFKPAQNLDNIITANTDLVTERLGEGTVAVSDRFNPWQEPADSWLIGIIRERFPHYEVVIRAVGFETAAFQDSHPHMRFVVIGFRTKDVHTHRERFEIASVGDMIVDTDQLILHIADHPEFQTTNR